MAGWNFADVWEHIALAQPDALAQVQGDRRFTWADMDRRAGGIALTLLEHGAKRDDKVATYLYNCPEYVETTFAAMKIAAVPVNTNYRYLQDELIYLWDNADAVAVVFHGAFAERVESVRPHSPKVKLWIWVDDGSGPCPPWAIPYEEAASSAQMRVTSQWDRSPDDLIFIYTGGTTGMPKGVMWRQDDLFQLSDISGYPESADLDAVSHRLGTTRPAAGIPVCPLMHGTGFLTVLSVLSSGGCVVTLSGRRFDAVELFDTIEREQVGRLCIVGDAFARPMLGALDEHPDRWNLSSLKVLITSGAMCSESSKEGLLAHHPGLMIADLLGASEALGVGMSISGGRGAGATASFRPGSNTRVLTDDGTDVEPGSGASGLLAVAGPTSLGYYKDSEKTAKTFRTVDGKRYLVPGDYATVETDGSIRLLGRGSVCINTGGEKVFPEEVEEVLKELPGVADAVVVGVPNERFGEAICAVVEPVVGGVTVGEDELVAHVKGRLADYKAPRHIWIVDSVGRNPNGKADYPRLKREAAAHFV